MILRKLKREERGETRALWENVFVEDTTEFLDYYYSEKTKDNEIYVIEKDGEIRSMLHLNPFEMKIGADVEKCPYIVAVATQKACRGRGFMTALLNKAVRDLHQQKVPFAFLMPASEAIYLPHHFRKITELQLWESAADEEKLTDLLREPRIENVTIKKAEIVDCTRMAAFANQMMEKEYEVYALRTKEYYLRMLREQAAQKGGILLAEKEGTICAMILYDQEDGLDFRELIAEKQYETLFSEAGILAARQKKNPMIMGRVIDPLKILSTMKCKKGMHTEFEFFLEDPVIDENSGTYLVRGNEERIVVRKKKGSVRNAECSHLSIAAFTSIVFGAALPKDAMEAEGEKYDVRLLEQLGKLAPLKPIFLNEIV